MPSSARLQLRDVAPAGRPQRFAVVHADANRSWPLERRGYRQPAACRALGSTGTLGLFALALGVILWIPHSPVVRIVPDAPLAVTFELAPVPSAPPAPSADLPPGPVQQEQEVSSAAEPKVAPKAIDLPLPTFPSVPTSAAPADEASNRASADARAVARSSAPPAALNPSAAIAARVTSASAEQAALANWQSELLGHLKAFLRYPRRAQSSRQQGVALVSATIDRRGKVLNARLDRGSGYPALDSEAVATVRRGSPVPPPTSDIRGDPVTVTIPIEFSLR